MRVLVTGGTGFTGAALVRRLLGAGHEVVALDRKPGIRLDELRAAGADVRLESVTDARTVDEAMRGVEVVHHVAAAFRETDQPDEYFYHVNVTGTRMVLEAAVRHGVRMFVHCSTCGVHGDVEAPPANEDAPIKPADYYQETKWLGELVVREFADRGLSTVILRPNALYGPGDPGRYLMLFRQVAKGWFPMFGPGEALYHPLFIENFVDAMMLATEESVEGGGTYLIADQSCCTIEHLVRKVGGALGIHVKIIRLPLRPLILLGHLVEAACKPLRVEPPLFPRRVDWFRQNRCFDIGRARCELGYVPRIGLEDGLALTGRWYAQHGYLGAFRMPPAPSTGSAEGL